MGGTTMNKKIIFSLLISSIAWYMHAKKPTYLTSPVTPTHEYEAPIEEAQIWQEEQMLSQTPLAQSPTSSEPQSPRRQPRTPRRLFTGATTQGEIPFRTREEQEQIRQAGQAMLERIMQQQPALREDEDSGEFFQ